MELTDNNNLTATMKKSDTKFPPCRVCGAKASGYHYGVISCEACKVFFRRYLRNNAPYICEADEACEILPKSRGCSFCRLQKCLSTGMSKDGVQKGRHTIEKKSKTIKEVKMLQQLQKSQEKEQYLSELAKVYIEVYLDNPFVDSEMIRQLPERQNSYLQLASARESVFGLQIPLPPRLHHDFFKSTGLDIDDRWKAMEKCLGCCQHEIITNIKYFKQLPGIDAVCPQDMCSLLKASCIDLSIFCSMVTIDPDKKLYTCMTCGATFGEYEFHMIYHNNEHHHLYRIVKKIKDLNLSHEELAVVTPLIFFTAMSDVHRLLLPEAVTSQRDQVSEVLKFVLKKSRGQHYEVFLGELMKVIKEFREISRMHSNIVLEFIRAYPNLDLPLIVHEIYGSGDTLLMELFSGMKLL